MFKYLKPNGKIDRLAVSRDQTRSAVASPTDQRRWADDINRAVDRELVAFAKQFPNRPECRDGFFALVEDREFDPKWTPAQCAADIIDGQIDPPARVLCGSLNRPTTDITAQVARFVFDWLDAQRELADFADKKTLDWLDANGCEASDRIAQLEADGEISARHQAELESSARWATR